jgi:hypothetical protein
MLNKRALTISDMRGRTYYSISGMQTEPVGSDMRQDQQDLTCKTRPAGSHIKSKTMQKRTSMQNKTSKIQHVKQDQQDPYNVKRDQQDPNHVKQDQQDPTSKKIAESAMQNKTSRIQHAKQKNRRTFKARQ